MGLFWNWYRKALPPEIQKMASLIEDELKAGRISQAEAERQRADVEKTLHGIFDSEEEQEKENA